MNDQNHNSEVTQLDSDRKINEQELQEFYERLEPVIDEEDAIAAAYREGLRDGSSAFNEIWLRGLHLLHGYKGNQKMALDCLFVAVGKGSEIGLQSAVEISKRHFGHARKKQAVNKCIQYFQERCGFPKIPGQRDDRSRRNMIVARKEQL